MSERNFWTQIKTGTYNYALGLLDGPYHVEALSYSLSWTMRYNAQTRSPWSVAAHACLVSEILAACGHATNWPLLLDGLHHDDHEVLTGDMNGVLKQWLEFNSQGLYEHESKRAQAAIERKLGIHAFLFGADAAQRAAVKAADIAALEAERRTLFLERLKWNTEEIVDPRMLAAGMRIIETTFPLPASAYGPAAQDRFISRHAVIMQRLVVA